MTTRSERAGDNRRLVHHLPLARFRGTVRATGEIGIVQSERLCEQELIVAQIHVQIESEKYIDEGFCGSKRRIESHGIYLSIRHRNVDGEVYIGYSFAVNSREGHGAWIFCAMS